ncbi:formate dehydrogenase N subunit beta transmembrane domain-containing protein [Gemmobacter sp. 24YEA27]|uniref:formate dehydrogenase N subunit beta transmembrane domain-containing protein n=1 Tax=Gemmobacter sp. 24YEA27 TaxID=3040672 RepID=UPI0032C41A27
MPISPLYAGLPDDPRISPVVESWKGATKTVGLAAIGLAAAGAVLHGLFSKGNTVTAEEEHEAEELVVKTAAVQPENREEL